MLTMPVTVMSSSSSSSSSSLALASSAAAVAAAHAHEGCMLSSHTHASAFMSYGVPTRLDFTARSAYSVSPWGPSMAQAYASICASVQLA